MWVVPNHLKCKVEDEDKRLKMISENLITNSKEFLAPRKLPIGLTQNYKE